MPLVLALGIGIAAAGGRGSSSLSGFGIVTLASLFPVLGVMGLAIFIEATQDVGAIAEAARGATAYTEPWHTRTPAAEMIGGVRAIVPLVIFLFIVMKGILHQEIHEAGIVAYGLSLALLGMIIFNVGLSYGLAKLGGQSGSLVPAAFAALEGIEGSPLYSAGMGIGVALIFAWILGFGATLAEPALNALGITVESLTQGAFRKQTLMYAVSLGVGTGIMLGVLKIIFAIPLAHLLIPGYLLAAALTVVSSEEFVNVAWDSAGVTTGPVTVPLVLAMGLGFGDAVDALEGFGILSMASVGPIVAVLATGLWIRARTRRRMEATETIAEQPEEPPQ